MNQSHGVLVKDVDVNRITRFAGPISDRRNSISWVVDIRCVEAEDMRDSL